MTPSLAERLEYEARAALVAFYAAAPSSVAERHLERAADALTAMAVRAGGRHISLEEAARIFTRAGRRRGRLAS